MYDTTERKTETITHVCVTHAHVPPEIYKLYKSHFNCLHLHNEFIAIIPVVARKSTDKLMENSISAMKIHTKFVVHVAFVMKINS